MKIRWTTNSLYLNKHSPKVENKVSAYLNALETHEVERMKHDKFTSALCAAKEALARQMTREDIKVIALDDGRRLELEGGALIGPTKAAAHKA